MSVFTAINYSHKQYNFCLVRMPQGKQTQGFLLNYKRKICFSCSQGVRIYSPVSHMVNVPVGMNNNTQHISDLLGPLLQGHVVLSQHHMVHVSRPVRQLSSLLLPSPLFCLFPLLEPICTKITLFLVAVMQ